MSFVVMDPDPLRRVEVALDDMRAGKMVILVDDEDRENEGDLTMAAEAITPEAINFMAKWGRGLICVSLTEERVERLALTMMSSHNQSPYETAFTVSIEAREGVSTGISAHDRALTVKVAADPTTGPNDIVTPGHIFPLRARRGGVLVRAGQTEGSVDLARLAGQTPAGVICEIMNDDGTMARMPDLERFAAEHKLHIVAIADMIKWRLRNERLVEGVFDGRVPVPGLGEFTCRVYRSQTDGGLHLAMWKGDLAGTPLVRVQQAAPIADVFRARSTDAPGQLELALQRIHDEGGLLLYLHVAGGRSDDAVLDNIRGHLLPPEGQEDHLPTRVRRAELREFGTGAQILLDLGVRRLKLLTNNPRKIVALEGFGLEVVERVSIEVDSNPANAAFMEAKRTELGHILNLNSGN